ncbi:MAG: hypothetical protein Q8P64_03620 [Deltaproteobacteria bacterium]|nr:hypothetical protein [Deltaproteobacteria bacterium]
MEKEVPWGRMKKGLKMANSYISLYVHKSITMNGMFGGWIQSSRWDYTFISFLPSDESLGYCHANPSGASD